MNEVPRRPRKYLDRPTGRLRMPAAVMRKFASMFLFCIAPIIATASESLITKEDPPAVYARYVIAAESYGQAIWYSARLSYRFNRWAIANTGYSYLSIPPGSSGGTTASYHVVPMSLSALLPLGSTETPLYAEILFGGNLNIGTERTARTGVRATATGQPFTPVVGLGLALVPEQRGIVVRAMCYVYQGIDSVGIESRRLPWLGGSIGYAF
jgi:hypothetical protein